MTIKEMNDHVDGFIRQSKLKVIRVKDPSDSGTNWTHNDEDLAFRMSVGRINPARENVIHSGITARSMHIPNIEGGFTYAVAMHEFGHFLGRTSSELEAHQWAYDHSPEWTEEMKDAMRHGLFSYVRNGMLTVDEVVAHLLKWKVKHATYRVPSVSIRPQEGAMEVGMVAG